MAPLGISVDGFPNEKVTLFEFGNFLLDIYILTQKIDGFPETHGTHTNYAPVCIYEVHRAHTHGFVTQDFSLDSDLEVESETVCC